MKQKTKTLLVLAAALVIIALVGSLIVDRLIKAGIEKGATHALGVETQLDKADLGIVSGSFALSGLRVTNPEKFTDPYFLQLASGEIKIILKSLLSDQVVLPSLTLTGIELSLEHNGDKGNYDVILGSVGGDKKKSDPKDKPSETSPEEVVGETEGKKYLLEELIIEDVTVHTQVIPEAGKLSRLTVKIPNIHMKNIGSDTGQGDLVAQLSGTVLQAVLTAVAKKGGDLIPETIITGLDGALEGLDAIGAVIVDEAANAAAELGKEIHDTVNEATEQIGEELDKVFEGLGGIIPKKKDAEE